MEKEAIILKLEKTDSTNSYARELIKDKNVDDGTIIWALEQTKGKGMGTNKWESEAGKNLTISIIFRPYFLAPEKQFSLLQAVALGVYDFLGLYLDETSIKWPNDIYTGNEKIAGILIENSLTGNKLDSSIAGIGININQIEFPAGLPNPSSLKIKTGMDLRLEESLDLVIQFINKYYNELKKGKTAEIEKKYHSSLYKLGEKIKFRTAGEEFYGAIKAVKESGELLIETGAGKLRSFGFKEVEY